MAEELEPNLDLVLDFRFTEIEAELFVVLQHLEAVSTNCRKLWKVNASV